MLDVTRVNAQTILGLNLVVDPRKMDSFQFGWDLAMALVLPHVQRRREMPGLQKVLTTKMDNLIQIIDKQKMLLLVVSG